MMYQITAHQIYIVYSTPDYCIRRNIRCVLISTIYTVIL